MNSNNKSRKPAILFVFGLYSALPVFLVSTSPDNLPLPLLLVPFLLLFAAIFVSALLIGEHSRFLRGLSLRKKIAIAGFVALVPMMLAVFQSLHQLTIRDLLIAFALIVGVIFYISRADFLR